jgi:hypothetical protein
LCTNVSLATRKKEQMHTSAIKLQHTSYTMHQISCYSGLIGDIMMMRRSRRMLMITPDMQYKCPACYFSARPGHSSLCKNCFVSATHHQRTGALPQHSAPCSPTCT